MTLFAMMVVDACLEFNCCTLAEENQKDFYTLLSEELTDNSYENSNMSWESRINQGDGNVSDSPTLAASTGAPWGGVAAHINPTKKELLEKMVQ